MVVRVAVIVAVCMAVAVIVCVAVCVIVIVIVCVRMRGMRDHMQQRSTHHGLEPDAGPFGKHGEDGRLGEVAGHRGDRHQQQDRPRHGAGAITEHPRDHQTDRQLVQHHAVPHQT